MLQNPCKIVLTKLTKSAFCSRALVLSSFFSKCKKNFPKLSKNLKIILKIINETFHNHAKSQPEIPFILCDTKMTN
jgi:hypothetical protein